MVVAADVGINTTTQLNKLKKFKMEVVEGLSSGDCPSPLVYKIESENFPGWNFQKKSMKGNTMALKDTVDMMLSDDYKDQFKAEYKQLTCRINHLQKMVSSMEKGTRKDKSKSSLDLLHWQLDVMRSYQKVLKRRAEVEKIEL